MEIYSQNQYNDYNLNGVSNQDLTQYEGQRWPEPKNTKAMAYYDKPGVKYNTHADPVWSYYVIAKHLKILAHLLDHRPPYPCTVGNTLGEVLQQVYRTTPYAGMSLPECVGNLRLYLLGNVSFRVKLGPGFYWTVTSWEGERGGGLKTNLISLLTEKGV